VSWTVSAMPMQERDRKEVVPGLAHVVSREIDRHLFRIRQTS